MTLYARGRLRLALAATQLSAFLSGCFIFGVLAVRDATTGKLLIIATLCVVVYWIKPQLMVLITIVLSFASLPPHVPGAKVFGPFTLYGHHVVLALAICYLIPVARTQLSSWLLPGIFTVTVMYFTTLGFEMGHAANIVTREAMILLEMVGGFILALLVVRCEYVRPAMKTLAVTLWFSAVAIVASSLFGIKLGGRSESLEATGSSEALRLITHTSVPAQAVLVTLFAAQIVGIAKPALHLALGVPSLIISLLGFSRDTLIGLAVAGVVAFAANLDWSAVRRSGRLAATCAGIFAITVPGMLFLLRDSRAGTWLDAQFVAFNHRVLGGVSGSALAVDSSNQERLVEDRELIHRITEAPVFGHGLGYAYRLPFGNEDYVFADTWATTYSHNFYLWWLCKAGAVGMAAFAVFALTPVVRALRRATPEAKIGAAVSMALIVMAVVDPIPEEPTEALVLGLSLGSAMAFAGIRHQRSLADSTEMISVGDRTALARVAA